MLLLRRGRITEVESNGLMLGAFDFATYPTPPAAWNKATASCSTPTESSKPPTLPETSSDAMPSAKPAKD
jgi:hypothetical protein